MVAGLDLQNATRNLILSGLTWFGSYLAHGSHPWQAPADARRTKSLAIPGERIGYLAFSPQMPEAAELFEARTFRRLHNRRRPAPHRTRGLSSDHDSPLPSTFYTLHTNVTPVCEGRINRPP